MAAQSRRSCAVLFPLALVLAVCGLAVAQSSPPPPTSSIEVALTVVGDVAMPLALSSLTYSTFRVQRSRL